MGRRLWVRAVGLPLIRSWCSVEPFKAGAACSSARCGIFVVQSSIACGTVQHGTARHSTYGTRLCPIKALYAVDALCPGCRCLNKTEICREILFPCTAEIVAKFSCVLDSVGFSNPAHRTVGAVPAPITCDCDLLVEQVVMATDDFYYGTSAFSFWAQFGLGNFQLKHLPVKLHRALARDHTQPRESHVTSTGQQQVCARTITVHPQSRHHRHAEPRFNLSTWALQGGPRQGGTTGHMHSQPPLSTASPGHSVSPGACGP